MSHRTPAFALVLAASVATAAGSPSAASTRHASAIALSGSVWDSMNTVWARSNEHWNELADVNTLTQMLGTGKPTQLEFMGCLRGQITRDTVWVTDWTPAHDMKRFQFAITGSCDHVDDAIGTFHTHPYRADSAGGVLKEPGLSKQDLDTFTAGNDRVLLVIWDRDSVDAALRAGGGKIIHPAPLVLRTTR